MNEIEEKGQATLLSTVIDRGLCTGCGACTQLCPYMRSHNADTVALFSCDRDEGRCFRYCPRTHTDWNDLKNRLFDEKDLTDELGALKGLYMTRSVDPEIQKRSQHGGTVTTLVTLAISEGLIEGCVLADTDESLLPKSVTVYKPDDVLKMAGSKFGNSPTVGEFNRVSALGRKSFGAVATPCQARALAKMKANPGDGDRERVDKLKLVIGLFCGWTLDWRKLSEMVSRVVDGKEVLAMDIPPSKHACMEIDTHDGIMEIPINEVNTCARQCCDYCTDMTAELADISVGSARSKDGWEMDKHWNQVIVRSEVGRQLLELAREKGILEFKEVPEENIMKLKAACLGKQTYGKAMLDKLNKSLNE